MSVMWEKAVRAAQSARLLFADDDYDGAVDRAYYAMFDAARDALETLEPGLGSAKTRAGLRRRFGKHIVKPGHVGPEVGRALSVTEEIRIVADYDTKAVDQIEATKVLADMERLLAAVDAFTKKLRS